MQFRTRTATVHSCKPLGVIKQKENKMKNIKKILVLLITISLSSCNYSTKNSVEINKSEIVKYENIFNDLKEYLTKENGKLWNHQLYGPILLVNQDDRIIIANEPDTKGFLKKDGKVYTGILPDKINISNTSLNWNGKRWTMVMLPLPKDYNERLSLLIHELFHRIQPKVGFAHLPRTNCDHLDKLYGRIYLKLELEALKKALASKDEMIQKEHIKNALLFRIYRQQLFPDAKENENLLELNEGLAEYTGTILSGRNDKDLREHYSQAIDVLFTNPTFVRSFAYRTIPVYGYFMKQKDENWNKKIEENSNLTDFITAFYNISLPDHLKDVVTQVQNEYNYDSIVKEETERAQKQKELIAKLDDKFQNNPIFTIPFQHMSVNFNPGNLIPYKNLGTVYPNLRITDDWGILSVEKGALLDKNWKTVIVSKPTKITDKLIEGDGWKLDLNKNWTVVKIEENYTLKKK